MRSENRKQLIMSGATARAAAAATCSAKARRGCRPMDHWHVVHSDVEAANLPACAPPPALQGPSRQGRTARAFLAVLLAVCLMLLVISHLSIPDDSTRLEATSKYLPARLRDRFHRLKDAIHMLASRRQRLTKARERRAQHARAEQRQHEFDRHVAWNTESQSWESQSLDGGVEVENDGRASNESLEVGLQASNHTPPQVSATQRQRVVAMLAPPAHMGLLSPPPPMSPPLLLRFGLEASCLHFQEPLEALARAVCDFDVREQRFAYEGGTRTLRYVGDTSQCVDYFASLQDLCACRLLPDSSRRLLSSSHRAVSTIYRGTCSSQTSYAATCATDCLHARSIHAAAESGRASTLATMSSSTTRPPGATASFWTTTSVCAQSRARATRRCSCACRAKPPAYV